MTSHELPVPTLALLSAITLHNADIHIHDIQKEEIMNIKGPSFPPCICVVFMATTKHNIEGQIALKRCVH